MNRLSFRSLVTSRPKVSSALLIGSVAMFNLALCADGATAQELGETVVLTNASIIDGVAAEPIRGATLVVSDGKIRHRSRDHRHRRARRRRCPSE